MAAVSRESQRIKDAPTKVLDEATRNRRLRKALEALEKDNFHDDPHANLVMSKKAPKFEDNLPDSTARTPRKRNNKTRSLEHLKQRFRKNFPQLLEEDQTVHRPEPPNYISARAPASNYPARHFCAVCGFFSNYTCVTCGTRFCSVKCQSVHKETRCLKFTA